MKIARFQYRKRVHWGIVDSNQLLLLKDEPYNAIRHTQIRIPLSKAKLLPPATPTKIVLVGLNYRDHARELNMSVPQEPIIFLKPVSALIGHRQPIRYPAGVKQLDYEAELAVIIKKNAHCLSTKKIKDYILGYTCLNDVTARDLQKKDGQWTRAKSFDTFCPLGPWCETELDINHATIQSYLNGQLRQSSSTQQFIFSVERLVAFISGIMSLYPGDVISTGTPCGVGPMKRGDTIEVSISGIGILSNNVA